MRILLTLAGAALALAPAAGAGDPPPRPRDLPVTRPEVKRALEVLKKARPRLPLPPLTDAQRKEWGDRPIVYNGLARFLYLPRELRGGDFFRGKDPAMSLGHPFKTMLFWIVSRTNNCFY